MSEELAGFDEVEELDTETGEPIYDNEYEGGEESTEAIPTEEVEGEQPQEEVDGIDANDFAIPFEFTDANIFPVFELLVDFVVEAQK